MNLVFVLLLTASIFCSLSGLLIFFGSEKGYRLRASILMLVEFGLSCLALAGLRILPEIPATILTYILFVIMVCFIIFSFVKMKANVHSRQKIGWKIMLCSLSVLLAYVLFVLFVLARVNVHIEWTVPFAASIETIVYFYVVLKYKILGMHNAALRIWSAVVLTAVFVAVYMSLLMVVSKYLFHVESSAEIIAINLVMITLVAVALPMILEANSAIASALSTRKVDLSYIVRRLNKAATQNVKYHDLAALLADHLHFNYVGLIVNGKLYNSKNLVVTAEQITKISMLEASNKKIWQDATGQVKEILDDLGIKAVAELRNAKGRPFGQILVGAPSGKIAFEKRDLSEIEMVINLVASIIDSKERLRG